MLRICETLFILWIWLPFLLTNCGNSGDSGGTGNARDLADFKRSGEVESHSPNAYYPFVDKIKVSSGDGYIDVTIYGFLPTTGDYISDIQVTRLRADIIVIPIAQPPPESGGEAITPFQKAVRIADLDKRYSSYTVFVMGWDFRTGARRLITETTEVKWAR